MGAEDVERQKPNVERMRLLGAKIHPVTSGTGTLKDAMNEALRYWVTNAETHFYIIGTAAGPHPYPRMVRDFQSVIGTEAREQILAEKPPSKCARCLYWWWVKRIGLFYPFLDDNDVAIYGVEQQASALAVAFMRRLLPAEHQVSAWQPNLSFANDDGQITDAHSISAGWIIRVLGLNIHGHDIGRVNYVAPPMKRRSLPFNFARLEGIIPALEPSHALAISAL